MDKLVVSGKQIFVFEHHNIAVPPWFLAKDSSAPPALLTLDYHTDTHLGFLNYNYRKMETDLNNEPTREELENEVNTIARNTITYDDLKEIVEKLENDEQIDFAIRSGIISHAYLIAVDINPQNVIGSNEDKSWGEEKSNINKIKCVKESVMDTWYSKQLGDGVVAFGPRTRSQEAFLALIEAKAKTGQDYSDLAVFYRYDLRENVVTIYFFSQYRVPCTGFRSRPL